MSPAATNPIEQFWAELVKLPEGVLVLVTYDKSTGRLEAAQPDGSTKRIEWNDIAIYEHPAGCWKTA